ncbi:MAG: alanine--tRNA ligase [Pirellulaceae bacterium]|jgi:alanyl-tRNA synthetase|nr:alanine--tRNA ligase [Pirellulaceae bacterium]
MRTDELREKYLSFFESKGHTRCASDVLVPTWDPSVLFTPAGMNQFKDHFLGKVKLTFTRATTCQKCLRTGDIENVGRTAYHHTFFEMLGNFSFGDYFKRDAILWAWEFCTSKRWLGIDPARLSVSVYLDDDEAAGIWLEQVGLPSSRIERMGESDNFWPARAPSDGPDGVCGPCSEIFYHDDFGEAVEIWNLVFTQFNRVGDPPDNLRPLPSRNIDTGMGLERTAATLQGVPTNYHIDILRPIVEAAAELCGCRYEPQAESGRRCRRIADHLRACAFAVHENVYPGAKAEKYVIRRLLRRAVLDGRQMGVEEPFLHQLVPVVVAMMEKPYPELGESVERVAQVIRQEEQSFFATIDAGLARVEGIFSAMASEGRVVVDGNDAAELYSTYGIPPELVESLAAERNFTFDTEGFRRAMIQHGLDSGKQQIELFKTGPIEALKKAVHLTRFLGYETEEATAEIKGIIAQHQLCDRVSEAGHAQPIVVVLDQTPCYGESGGQVGDSGEIAGPGFLFRVSDTQKDGELILHVGHLVSGELRAGKSVTVRVNRDRRAAIRRAHSATHILHYALQRNLGRHAQQQGSKVDEDWLRFDFTHLAAVSEPELRQVERDVQERIRANEPVQWDYVPLAEAREKGAMMLFGEKYPDPVRLVTMGQFSRELCGGTHVSSTLEVEDFEILSEESVSTGTRRVVALTGRRAREQAQQTRATLQATARLLGTELLAVPAALRVHLRVVRDLRKQLTAGTEPARPVAADSAEAAADGTLGYEQVRGALREAARLLNVALADVPERTQALLNEAEQLKARVAELSRSGLLSPDALISRGTQVGDVLVIVCETPGANPNLMRQWIDQIRARTQHSAIFLAAAQGDDKVLLVAGVSRDLVAQGMSAGDWVKGVAPLVGGGGGGRPDLAQAGGKQPQQLPAALQQAQTLIQQMLAKRNRHDTHSAP